MRIEVCQDVPRALAFLLLKASASHPNAFPGFAALTSDPASLLVSYGSWANDRFFSLSPPVAYIGENNGVIHTKLLERSLAHSRCSTNVWFPFADALVQFFLKSQAL